MCRRLTDDVINHLLITTLLYMLITDEIFTLTQFQLRTKRGKPYGDGNVHVPTDRHGNDLHQGHDPWVEGKAVRVDPRG